EAEAQAEARAAGRRSEHVPTGRSRPGRPDDDRHADDARDGNRPDGLALRARDRLREPGREARRPQRNAVDDGVLRPAVRDRLSLALEHVLVAKARSADADAAGVNPDAVVEEDGLQVTDMRLGRQRLVAVRLQAAVAVAEAREVVDPRDLEPDEIGSVVRHALRVRLREPDRELGREPEALHRLRTIAR